MMPMKEFAFWNFLDEFPNQNASDLIDVNILTIASFVFNYNIRDYVKEFP